MEENPLLSLPRPIIEALFKSAEEEAKRARLRIQTLNERISLLKPLLKFEKLDGEIKIIIEKGGAKGKALMGTIKKHLLNLFKGVSEGFEYKLKVIYTHFPISVEFKDNEFIVKNFLGQKDVKKIKIPRDVKIDISKDEIKVFGINKELAGQVAANLERLTKLTKRDRRKFQDGIFIFEKPK